MNILFGLFCSVLLSVSSADDITSSCSLGVSVDTNGEPICTNHCDEGEQPIYCDGVLYRRTEGMKESFGKMVAVKFTDGEITKCEFVPYEDDYSMMEKQMQIESCLIESTDVDIVVVCPDGFTLIGDSCYAITPTRMNWGNNRNHCKSLSSDLATIEDADEQQNIASELPVIAWIGLNDLEQEGVYKNVDGRISSYFNWRTGEPNNARRREDCVLMKPLSNFTWWDAQCKKSVHGLCEVSSSTLTHPVCPGGELNFGGSCYRISEEFMTFEEGRNFCENNEGYLAFVNKEEEQKFLADNLDTSVLTGLTVVSEDGTTTMSEFGVPFFTSWSEHTTYSDGKKCVVMNSLHGYDWMTVDCSSKNRVLCERLASSEI